MRWMFEDEEGRLQPEHGHFEVAQEGRGRFVSAADMPPLPKPVPYRVTAAQGGIALIRAGLMDSVMAVVNDPATPAEIVWSWQKSQDWERDSQALAYLADKAGITQAQLDSMFIDADGIKP